MKTAKKFLSIMIALVLCLGVLIVPANSVNAETYGIYEYEILEDGTAKITGYTSTDTDKIVIPKEIDGYPVTRIDERAFLDNTWLKSVIIPDSVTSIGTIAFGWSTGLTDVTIPNSVKSLEDGAFAGCSSLTSVTVPGSVTVIGGAAFAECISLTDITISEGVTSIEESAFQSCTSLTSITIPASVTFIGNEAFGFDYDEAEHVTKKRTFFIIKGYGGTEAEKYAQENGFIFVDLNNSSEEYADYSKVEAAIAKIPKDLSIYTDESVKVLNDAYKAVKEGMKESEQAIVDGWADAIEKAIAGLEKKSFEDGFNDVQDPTAWYYETVYQIASTYNELGHPLMSGYSNGSHNFGPADPLTRQDFAVILYRLADEPEIKPMANPFKDTIPSGYYYNCVLWAKAENVIAGYNDGNFGVGDKITREQVATILYRFAKDYMHINTSEALAAGDLSKFKDGTEVSSWAEEGLTWATGAGVITGKSKGTEVAARGDAARAEIGAMILRFITYTNNTEPIGTMKVGLICLHDENSTYDLNFINGFKEACEAEGVEYLIRTNISETQACYYTAVDLVDKGCTLIIADGFGHEDYIIRAAKEFPDVQFCHVSGTKAHTEELDNYANAFASIYEGRFLAGVAAGMKLNEMIAAGKITADQAKMGYVGAYTYPEIISGYTSFYLGAKSVCPTVTMDVTFTASWYDPAAEQQGAETLIKRGCVLISQHADSLGAPTACENAGVPNISYNGSTQAAGPNTFIVSSRINWAPYYKYAIQCVKAGKNVDTDWTGTLETGSVQLSEVNEAVAAEGTAAAIEEVKAKLASGELKVFDITTFTKDGAPITSYMADVDSDPAYEPDTEVIIDGAFAESTFRSAPYFDILIDGITLLNIAF